MTHYQPQPRHETESAWISDRTKIKISIAGVLAICCSIIGATWAARGYLESWKGELTDHFTKIESSQNKMVADVAEAKAALSYKWSANQMTIWAAQLDRANRTVRRGDAEFGLIVPDPSTVPAHP